MGRQQTVNYTALDIKIFDEKVTTQTYIELFEDLGSNHREVPLSRDNYLHLVSVKPINEDKPINGFVGEIFKRNSLPSDWYNTVEGTRNTKENVEDKYIPKELKAKVRFFKFTFYPLQRKLICEVHHERNKISESVIEDFLKKLLDTDHYKKKFNRIDVNLVPEKITAEKIIQIPQLMELELVVLHSIDSPKKQLSSLEKEVFSEMAENNIRKYCKIITSEKSKFLELSQKNKELISLAVENGYVKFKFKNLDNIVENKSSNDTSPFIKRVTYDTKNTDLRALLLRETSKISEDLVKR